MFNGFSRSVKGASHDRSGLVCQDSSSHEISESFAVAVVADGHGSKKHFRSNMGSKFAVEATVETISRFFADPEEFEANFPKNHKSIIKNIQKQIITIWNAKVNEHFKDNPVTAVEKRPFTPDELAAIPVESYYGTTLIAAVLCKEFTFGVQIGDGSLVLVYDNGETTMPMGYEEANPANITASICNQNASSMFESFYIPKNDKKKVIAAFASTDGLYTSFGSDYDFLDYHTLIASQLVNIDAFQEIVVKNLIKRSHFGTEDDISLSCVFDAETLEAQIPVLKQKVAENKKSAQDRRSGLSHR
ncbi:MAG: protein phosphatase 2C domain-containing protein [Ruminococcus sp.]|nr:protein phosphatase 2C domain-containing protein [Ruminococcus sp.]